MFLQNPACRAPASCGGRWGRMWRGSATVLLHIEWRRHCTARITGVGQSRQFKAAGNHPASCPSYHWQPAAQRCPIPAYQASNCHNQGRWLRFKLLLGASDCIGGSLVVWPGMLFPNSSDIKAAAHLCLSYLQVLPRLQHTVENKRLKITSSSVKEQLMVTAALDLILRFTSASP